MTACRGGHLWLNTEGIRMQTIEGEPRESRVEPHAARQPEGPNMWNWRFISCDTLALARVGSGKNSFLEIFEELSAVLTDQNNSYLAFYAHDAGIHVRQLQTGGFKK